MALHLVRTCQLKGFKLPEYKGLTTQDQANKEYSFEIQYTFGYSYADFCEILTGCFNFRESKYPSEPEVPTCIIQEIAKMLGNSRFDILLKVYFDKTKVEEDDWHEQ